MPGDEEDRTVKFNHPGTGTPMWGITGMVKGQSDGADGWYVAGTFDGSSDNGWQEIPPRRGRGVRHLTNTVRMSRQISVAYVSNGDVIDYRTVHGPVTSLKILKKLIEREIMVHSPVSSGN